MELSDGEARTILDTTLCDVLELVPDAVLITDQHGQIVHLNRLAERLFGYRGRHCWAGHWKSWFRHGIAAGMSICGNNTAETQNREKWAEEKPVVARPCDCCARRAGDSGGHQPETLGVSAWTIDLCGRPRRDIAPAAGRRLTSQ